MTIPGVSFYSSLLIMSEIGETDRFDEAKEVVSYAGLDPVVRDTSWRSMRNRSVVAPAAAPGTELTARAPPDTPTDFNNWRRIEVSLRCGRPTYSILTALLT